MPETPKNLRWREKMDAPPAGMGGVVRTYVRVVEAPGPVPQGCEATTDPVHDWKLEKEEI